MNRRRTGIVSHRSTGLENNKNKINEEKNISNNLESDNFLLDFSLKIPEGQCEFYISEVYIEKNIKTKYGSKDKIVVEFKLSFSENGQTEKYDLKRKYNKSKSLNSYIYKLCKIILGHIGNKKVNLKDLIGATGTCKIRYGEMDNGDIFPEIYNISVYDSKNILENSDTKGLEEDTDE